MLKIINIKGGYSKDNNVLNSISFEIAKGETLAIIGQNGSGKSSLAKAIINTLPYRSGEVWLDGENISKLPVHEIIHKGVGIFLQGGKVFPHLTAKENLLFTGRNLPSKKLKSRIIELQDYFSVFKENKLWNSQANYLSGGQRNMLSLLMVLLNKPKFLIIDEFSAGLSAATINHFMFILKELLSFEGLTILIIEQNLLLLKLLNVEYVEIKGGLIYDKGRYECKK